MAQTIYIEDYSAKSFVVRGETREYKESLRSLGGKWNSRLTDKETGDKFGAWLFWSDKRSELDGWFKKGCPDVQSTRISGSEVRQEPTRTYGSTLKDTDRQTVLNIERLEAKIDYLSKMLEAVCTLHNIDVIKPEVEETKVPIKQRRVISKKTPTKTFVEKFEIEDDNENELPVKTPKRLLGRTKH